MKSYKIFFYSDKSADLQNRVVSQGDSAAAKHYLKLQLQAEGHKDVQITLIEMPKKKTA